MSGNILIISILRFIGLVLIQVLILKNIQVYPPYVHVYIYPLFILLLPFRTPVWASLLLGFFIGVSVDIFYDTLGLNAAAGVIVAYARTYILKGMEPRGGYEMNQSPNKHHMGMNWFLQYAAILTAIHLLALFLLEEFRISQIGLVLVKTIIAFIISMILISLHHLIFNPKE